MLILKVTRDCNFRCSYCYIADKDRYKGEVMSFELFKKIINRITFDKLTILPDENNPVFYLVFHGGEPTIIGYENLARMLEYAKSTFEKYNIKYSFGLQTNMSLLDDNMLGLCHKYNIHLGASFDGIKSGNQGRTKILDEDFFIDKINKTKKWNIDIGFLLVVNKFNVNTTIESKKYLKRLVGTDSIKINYSEDIFNNGKDSIEVDGEEYFSKVLQPILIEFLETGILTESNIELIFRKYFTDILAKDKISLYYNCSGPICGAGINVIEVSPDGMLHFCGRYSKDFKEATIMHIDDANFLMLKQLKRYIDFAYEKHKVLLESKCDICYAKSICDFGCMAFHFSKYKKWGIRKDLVCPIYKSLYKWLAINQLKIIEAYKENIGLPFYIEPYYETNGIKDSYFLRDLKQKLNIEVNYENKKFKFDKAK